MAPFQLHIDITPGRQHAVLVYHQPIINNDYPYQQDKQQDINNFREHLWNIADFDLIFCRHIYTDVS